MSEKSLKPQQIDAIQKDTDLLISANAGSGKTFVMLKRVLYYIINKNMNITDFLLVTFTDAAASEMRFKLQDELTEAYYQAKTPEIKKHIKKQINLLPQADISTIHTFCFKLIKKYFYLINISASVSIADEEESEVIKQNALEQTLNFFAQNRSEDFIFLASSYDSKRNFNSIKDITLKIFNFLQNQPDQATFYNQIDKIYNGIDNSQITDVINDYVYFICQHFLEVFKEEKQKALQADFDKLVLFCEEIEEKLSAIKKENSFAQNHEIIFNLKLPTKPRKVKDLVLEELSEHCASKKEKLQKELSIIKEKIYLDSDITSLKENLKWCKQNVETLIKVEKRFEEEYKLLKDKRNLVDFSDLEKFALKILQSEQKEEIVKDKKFIFVDEYQDVNNIQEQIVLALHDKRYNKLFLVGDPKQSIYRFRNTNPQIIIDKQKKFKESKTQDAISLVYNFRSQKPILDFVNFVFEKIMTQETAGIDYQQGNNFQTDNTSNEPAVEINLIFKEKVQKEKIVPNEVYSVMQAPLREEEESDFAKSEAYVIFERIASLIEEAKKKNEPFSYRDIAILHRSRSPYVDKVIEVLKQRGIPISSSSNENLMEELVKIKNEIKPDEILLIIDAMMGQDAINVITGFNEKLPLTGCILTKMDGDTKGGVALSLRHLTNVPIKLIGDSEKLDGLSEFVPTRMADRILGMGDIVSIAEKASEIIDEEEALNTAKKLKKGNFDLEDFLTNMKQIKKLGPLENIIKMLPGARKMGLNNINIDPKQLARVEAIILSMTPEERRKPEILKASRKQRIAKGSGTSVEEVNRLLKQFEQMKIMMKQFSNSNFKMPF